MVVGYIFGERNGIYKVRVVWYINLNTCFQFLNNIMRIFTFPFSSRVLGNMPPQFFYFLFFKKLSWGLRHYFFVCFFFLLIPSFFFFFFFLKLNWHSFNKTEIELQLRPENKDQRQRFDLSSTKIPWSIGGSALFQVWVVAVFLAYWASTCSPATKLTQQTMSTFNNRAHGMTVNSWLGQGIRFNNYPTLYFVYKTSHWRLAIRNDWASATCQDLSK